MINFQTWKLYFILIYIVLTITACDKTPKNSDHNAIAARLKPVGEVQLDGQITQPESTTHEATMPLTPIQQAEQIYEKNCITCHDAGVAGAPKLGDANAWAERSKQGIDVLIKNAINGIKFMPARGTCLECSDEDIALTVKYMLEQSK